MPHVFGQQLSADEMPPGIGQVNQHRPARDNKKLERLSSRSIQLEIRCLPGKNFLMIPETACASSRSPKSGVLPTPPPSSSTYFDSPQTSSSPSPMSSPNVLAVMPRVTTPLAELEDTSIRFAYPELEDTSACAIRSRTVAHNSSYTVKSKNTTTRSLIAAVDQRFSDYEAEIRFLRNSLANAENSLREVRSSLNEARVAADDSNHALGAAQETISIREYELEVTKHALSELVKDVKHCQAHHRPPTPPSKLRDSDGAVSRFNADLFRSPKHSQTTNSPSRLSPSMIGRPVDATPRLSSENSPIKSASRTTRPTLATHSDVSSPSVAGSPSPQTHSRNRSPRAGMQNQITTDILAAAVSSAASPSRTLGAASDGQVQEGCQVRKDSLEELITASDNGTPTSAAQKSHLRGRRKKQSSVSTPNLRDAQNLSPGSKVPRPSPQLPKMSGGLGILEVAVEDIRDGKLQKRKAGFGDIFRRKDHVRDQSVSIFDNILYAIDSGVL